MSSITRIGATTLLIGLAGALSGCATPATGAAMTVSGVEVARQHQSTVAIDTQGGAETSSMGSSSISDSAFAEAIEASIIENRVFSQVVERDGADYVLGVSIISMDKPSFGFSFTVSMEAAWSLTDLTTNTAVMRESIVSTYTAGAGDAFVGTTRLRLAVEGAARENIRKGLAAISELEFD
jgi:hypothetical protein